MWVPCSAKSTTLILFFLHPKQPTADDPSPPAPRPPPPAPPWPPRPPLPAPPQSYPIASATNRGPAVSDHPRLALLRSPDLADRGRAWIHPPQRQVRRCCARPWPRLHPFRLRVRRCSCRAAPHATWRRTAPSAVPVRRPPPQRAVLWRGTPGSAPPRHPLRSIQSFTFRKNLLAVQSSAQPLHGSAPNRLASCHIFRATIAFPPQSSEVYGRRCAVPPSIQSVRLL